MHAEMSMRGLGKLRSNQH